MRVIDSGSRVEGGTAHGLALAREVVPVPEDALENVAQVLHLVDVREGHDCHAVLAHPLERLPDVEVEQLLEHAALRLVLPVRDPGVRLSVWGLGFCGFVVLGFGV